MSLVRQLLLWLLLPQLVLWLAGGLAAYRLAASYVDQALDNALLQSSRSLARQLKPLGNGLLVDFPKAAQSILEADPEDRQFYMVSSPPGQFLLGNHHLPLPPEHLVGEPKPGHPYFYDGWMPVEENEMPQRVRIVALYIYLDGEPNVTPAQVLVQVARSNNTREQLVRRIWADMLLPLFTLILLMTVIVWFGIRAGLLPLKRLIRQVEGRAASDLRPLELEVAPRELYALANALNALLADTRKYIAAQQRFIADAAHQLRTPLAGLKSQTELALQQIADPDVRQRLLRVHESAHRSAHLVNQLLLLARTDSEAISDYFQRLDLKPLLRDWVAEWVPRALKLNIDLGWEEHSCHEPVLVWVEPVLLREAIANLIDNAIRYGGHGVEITVGIELQKEKVMIWVQDNGPGIAPELRHRVFERFFRGTSDGHGCGLGLAIVRDIVRRHRGDIDLCHPENGGLKVCLFLPRAA